MGDPRERPKVYIEALHEWFEIHLETLGIHLKYISRT